MLNFRDKNSIQEILSETGVKFVNRIIWEELHVAKIRAERIAYEKLIRREPSIGLLELLIFISFFFLFIIILVVNTPFCCYIEQML